MSRFAASLPQLATYIERDGWKRQPGAPSGSTTYASPDGYFRVTIDDAKLPELDRERDAAYARVAAARRRDANR